MAENAGIANRIGGDTGSKVNVMDELVDGPDGKITVAEALKGYQRNADYTKKNQDVADLKRDLEAKEKQMEDVRNFAENSNNFFQANPDIYQQAVAHSKGEEPTKTPSNDGEAGNTKPDEEKKPESPEMVEMRNIVKQQSEQIKTLTDNAGTAQKDIAGFHVEKAMKSVKGQFELKDDAMKDVITHANNNFNNSKSYEENLVSSYKTLAFDELESNKKSLQEKEDAKMLTSTVSENGQTRQLSDEEQLFKQLDNDKSTKSEVSKHFNL